MITSNVSFWRISGFSLSRLPDSFSCAEFKEAVPPNPGEELVNYPAC